MFGGFVGKKLAEIVSGLITLIFDYILEPLLGLSSLNKLIFANGDTLIWGFLTEKVYNETFAPLYSVFMVLAYLVLFALIVVFGIKTALTFGSPQGRINFVKEGFTLFFVAVFITKLPIFYNIIFDLNSTLVNIFSAADKGILTDEKVNSLGSPIGMILFRIVQIGIDIWANFYYLMREITLIILLSMGPIFLALYASPKLRSLASNWQKETLTTIFVQPVHAMVYWILTTIALTQESLIGTAICAIVFIPVSNAVKNLFGLSGQFSDGITRAGAASGMSSLYAMAGAMKGMMGGKSLAEVAGGAVKGLKNVVAGGGDTVGDTSDSAKDGIKGADAATDKKAQKMLENGKALANLGKGAVGAFGAIAGAGTGPLGSIVGANIGSKVGETLGGMVGRTGTAAMDALKERRDRMNNLLNPNQGENGKVPQDINDEVSQVANALAEQDAHQWDSKDKDKAMADLRSRFPDASNSELEEMYQKEQASRKAKLVQGYENEISRLVEDNEAFTTVNDEGKKQLNNSLLDKWEAKNRDLFDKDFEASNPQMGGETNEAYQQRKDNAFKALKTGMAGNISQITDQAIADSTLANGKVDKGMLESKIRNGFATLDSAYDDTSKLVENGQVNPLAKQAMMQNWLTNNRASLEKEFTDTNPQLSGESGASYEARKNAHVLARTQQASSELNSIANNAIKDSTNPDGTINQSRLNSNLANGFNTTSLKGFTNQPLVQDGKVNPTAQANMVEKWASNNRQSFNEQYAVSNPKGTNETQAQFEQRREVAFTAQKQVAADNLNTITSNALKNATDANGNVDMAKFNNSVSTGILQSGFKGFTDNNVVQARDVANAVSQTFKNPLLTGTNRLNGGALANVMTQRAVASDRQAFISGEMARNNISEAQATQKWETEGYQASVSTNTEKYASVASAVQQPVISNSALQAMHRPTISDRFKAASIVASTDLKNLRENSAQLFQSAKTSAQTAWVTSGIEGNGMLKSVANTAISTVTAVGKTAGEQLVEKHGSYVQAHAAGVKNIGYVGGVLLGSSGYQTASLLAHNLSPLKNGMNNEIASAKEVMQMAQTTTDPLGNEVIAPGAVRQVVTPNESYIEVQKKDGTIAQVSRLTKGHSGLSHGDVVYQDLTSQNGMLVPVRRGNSDTYKQLADGSIIPSDVKIDQNPNTLLRQTVEPSRFINKPLKPIVAETYNIAEISQIAVKDANGNIADGAIRQISTPTESFVEVVNHDGERVRISHVGNGNEQLSGNEMIYRNLKLTENGFEPQSITHNGVKMDAYKLDNMNQPVKSSVQIPSPNTLFTQLTGELESIRSGSSYLKGKEYASYSQKVDMGQFYTEDLQGFSNLQMVVENNRKFIVGQKDDATYRLSRVWQGDTRVGVDDVIQIPLTLDGTRLTPAEIIAENVMKGNRQTTTDLADGYYAQLSDLYSTSALQNIMQSRYYQMAKNSNAARDLLSNVRQKQGMN